MNRSALAKTVIVVVIFVVIALFLAACGAGYQDCGPDEVQSEDYGCIEKDDLDLNDDGSFEDEEREWDDD